ncbi:DUF11 domain-containing protein [Planomonospora venezuelensis]|uniref:Putative repeat protein (TIGR01451 family) n=1 Tax=Planomonospora venezuelensis TaxID=1999 RepID=A0A841D258_PLAVE|nr:DUF11 domain-containing protein [Planomonospora venezuelensis]MBB5962265.1 putative repeat protein (TIGR01451 family) [Planomonospora venezuelensis]
MRHGAARAAAVVVALALAVGPGAARAQTRGPDPGGADLSVLMGVSPARAQPGQPLVYRVRVRNAGPGEAVLPVLTVRLPAGVDVLHADVAECLPGRDAREVVCSAGADIPAGSSGEVRITGLVRPGARGPLQASATIFSEVVDGRPANDSARVLTPVDEGADLAIRLTGRSRPDRTVRVGAVVRNRGPRAVRDALVVFRAAGARFLSARGARCRPRSGYVGCALPAVGSGGRARIGLVFRPRGRTVNAEVSVFSAGVGDRRPRNNTARTTVR